MPENKAFHHLVKEKIIADHVLLGAFLPATPDCFLTIWAPLLGLKIWVIVVSGIIMAILEGTSLENDWPFMIVSNSFPFVLARAKARVR